MVLDMDMDIVIFMASVRLSPKPLLTPTFCMEDMVAILDMLDMDMVLDMDMDIVIFMASVRLKPSPRLLLTPTFCMEDMAILDMLDIEDMLDMDTHMVQSTDNLDPNIKMDGATILVFFISDQIFQCLIPYGDG